MYPFFERLAARHAIAHHGVPSLDEPVPEAAPNALPG
jgi:hypothetical protein